MYASFIQSNIFLLKLAVSVIAIALRFVNLLEIGVQKPKAPCYKWQVRKSLCFDLAQWWCLHRNWFLILPSLFLIAIRRNFLCRTCILCRFCFNFSLGELCTDQPFLAALLRLWEIFCTICPKTLLKWKSARGDCVLERICFLFAELCPAANTPKQTRFPLLHCPKVVTNTK